MTTGRINQVTITQEHRPECKRAVRLFACTQNQTAPSLPLRSPRGPRSWQFVFVMIELRMHIRTRPGAAHTTGAPPCGSSLLLQFCPVFFRRSLRCSFSVSAQSKSFLLREEYNSDVASREFVKTTHNESSAAGAPK